MNVGLNGYKEYRFSAGDATFVFFIDDGALSNETKEDIVPHSHRFCEIFYVLKGVVHIKTEKEVLEAQVGDCAVINTNEEHKTITSEDANRIVVSLFLEKNLGKTSPKYYKTFSDILKNCLILKNFSGGDAFRRFVRYFSSNLPDKDQLIIACFHELIFLIKEETEATERRISSFVPSDSKNYRNYIIESYFLRNFRNASLSELSDQLHLSRQQTQRLVKKMYGQSFGERVTSIKINNALKLLESTNIPVLQIAFELGYQSTNSFFAAFKKAYGISPKQYRMKFLRSQNN